MEGQAFIVTIDIRHKAIRIALFFSLNFSVHVTWGY